MGKYLTPTGAKLVRNAFLMFEHTKNLEHAIDAVDLILALEMRNRYSAKDPTGAPIKKVAPQDIERGKHMANLKAVFAKRPELTRFELVQVVKQIYQVGNTLIEKSGGWLDYFLDQKLILKMGYAGSKRVFYMYHPDAEAGLTDFEKLAMTAIEQLEKMDESIGLKSTV